MHFRIIFATALLFYLVGAQAQGPTKAQIKQVKDAKKAVRDLEGTLFPSFSLTDESGNEFTTENTKGKYLLFNFWFTRCKPCIEEIPELNAMVARFDQREDVLFLAPTFDTAEQVEKFQRRFSFDYQLFPDEKSFCMSMNVRSYPTHILIAPNGIVEKVIIGYSPRTVGMLEKSLEKLLSAK